VRKRSEPPLATRAAAWLLRRRLMRRAVLAFIGTMLTWLLAEDAKLSGLTP
jgi:hypothetical protein